MGDTEEIIKCPACDNEMQKIFITDKGIVPSNYFFNFFLAFATKWAINHHIIFPICRHDSLPF